MTLRKKTLILISTTFVSLILLLYILSQLVLLRSFAGLEEQSARQNVARALDALSRELSTLGAIASDWAEWDDTYAFIEDSNLSYIESNLVDATFTALRLNLMLFIHSSGQIVFSKAFDLQNQKEIPVPESLQTHLSADSLLLQPPDAEESTTGIVLLPEGPLLVALWPILPSEHNGPVRGTLIMGRYLDTTEIEQLAGITHLSLMVSRFDDPQIPSDLQAAHASWITVPPSESQQEGSLQRSDETPVLIRPLSAQTMAGYALLKDIYGKPALVLRVEMSRDIYRQGQISVYFFALLLLMAGLASGSVTLSLLEKFILSRLARLSAEVSQIGRSGGFSTRVAVTGKDELANLANAINGTLTALEQSLQEVTLLSRVITLTASAANLQAALQEICTELAHFFQVPQASFALLNPQRTTAEVIAEYRAPDRPSALGLLIPIADNPSMTYILQHKTPLAIADAQSDPLLAPMHELMRQQNIASILLVPILIGGEVAGTLGIDALQRREFSEADIALAQNVANQVGQVLERLHLFAITQEHAERMSRLASLGESLSRLLTFDEVVALIGQGALSLSGADRAAVYLRNPDDTISYPWSQGLSQAYLAQVITCIEELPGGRLPERFEPMLISDIRALQDGARFRHLSRVEGYQAVAFWPLVYEGRALATVGCYYDAPHTWSEAEQEAMQIFARQAAVALENARLYTSLQETNERLQAAVQARDQMIQSVSHELRTPLALIMGYVELLSEKTIGPLNLEQEYTLSVLHSQSERLHYMVNRLLTLQTLDTRVLEKIPLEVGHLLREMVRAWEAQAAKTGVELRLDVSPDLPSIMADYELLNQVFVNLLDNAIKFSPNGGIVTVRAYETTDDKGQTMDGRLETPGVSRLPSVVIAVTDQGIGIPPDKLELLFTRFYQADGGPARQFGGMGIGLALCKAIVEAHGGQIWAESEGEGQGSTFYVALPAGERG